MQMQQEQWKDNSSQEYFKSELKITLGFSLLVAHLV